MWTVV